MDGEPIEEEKEAEEILGTIDRLESINLLEEKAEAAENAIPAEEQQIMEYDKMISSIASTAAYEQIRFVRYSFIVLMGAIIVAFSLNWLVGFVLCVFLIICATFFDRIKPYAGNIFPKL